MFWYIVGFFAFLVSARTLWACASAFGMEEDGTPPSEYEKQLGLGAKLKETSAHHPKPQSNPRT